MDIPFPVIFPPLVDSKWFNADCPYDEEAELTALEQENQRWRKSIGQKFMNKALHGKPDPEPMEEEVDVNEEEGNEEFDVSDDSHEGDEDELALEGEPPEEAEPERIDDLNNSPDSIASDQSIDY